MSDANNVLFGAGVPAIKLTQGDVASGRITAISEPYQEREYDKDNPGNGKPKFFPSGDPVMSFTVDIATGLIDPTIADDDGVRRLYMDGARIKRAVRDAIRTAGARAISVGSHISVTCTHYDVEGDIRSGKNYAVTYTPGNPASNVLMGQPAQQAAPVQQQAAPVQQAPAPVQYAPPATPAPQAPAPVQYAPPATPAPQVAPAPAPVAPVQPAGPTPEQLAALTNAGIDPASVFPGWTPQA